MKKIKEIFSLPVSLDVVDTVDGVKLYSSINLRDNFIEAFKRSGRGSDIANEIDDLVKKRNLIVPCYKSKGIFSFLRHKFFGEFEETAIMAFYHQDKKKVYILIDNNISPIGTASNDKLVSTTMHECMHLASSLHLNQFISITKTYLHDYYKNAFMGIFKLNTDKFDVDKIVNFLSSFEGKHIQLTNKLGAYAGLLENEFQSITTLDREAFIKKITDIMTATKVSLYSFSTFTKIYGNYVDIFRALTRAYELAFNAKNNVTTSFQEMYSVSEVICVLAELKPDDPKIKQVIKMI
jgi:uncharacterized protein YqgV (UPF0045/DUF77 family)